MNTLGMRYETLIKQIAALYSDDPMLRSHIESITVVGEKWDDNRGGGHLRFRMTPSAVAMVSDTIDAWANDEDGTPIEIIFHCVNGSIDWGEWVRVDAMPVLRWPPPSVCRNL